MTLAQFVNKSLLRFAEILQNYKGPAPGSTISRYSLYSVLFSNYCKNGKEGKGNVICQVSCVSCQESGVRCPVSPVTCHLSPVTCHLSPVTCHLSPVTCHLSPVTCHLSPVTCHLSPVICKILPVTFYLYCFTC